MEQREPVDPFDRRDPDWWKGDDSASLEARLARSRIESERRSRRWRAERDRFFMSMALLSYGRGCAGLEALRTAVREHIGRKQDGYAVCQCEQPKPDDKEWCRQCFGRIVPALPVRRIPVPPDWRHFKPGHSERGPFVRANVVDSDWFADGNKYRRGIEACWPSVPCANMDCGLIRMREPDGSIVCKIRRLVRTPKCVIAFEDDEDIARATWIPLGEFLGACVLCTGFAGEYSYRTARAKPLPMAAQVAA